MPNNEQSPWNWSKLVEEGDNGEIILLRENFNRMIKLIHHKESENIPIVLMSAMGPPSCGKSLVTNLFAEYLRFEGKSWSKSLQNNGLPGFAYGPDRIRSKLEDAITPDEHRSGIYFWPTLFPLNHSNGEKLLWIMHVHFMEHSKHSDSIEDHPLNKFLLLTSSVIVDILWNGEVYTQAPLKDTKVPIKNEACQHIVYLDMTDSGRKESDDSKLFPKEATFALGKVTLSDENGQVILKSNQIRKWTKIINFATDATIIRPKKFQDHDLKIGDFEGFFDQILQLVNSEISTTKTSPMTSKLSPKPCGERQSEKPQSDIVVPLMKEKITPDPNIKLLFDSTKRTPTTTTDNNCDPISEQVTEKAQKIEKLPTLPPKQQKPLGKDKTRKEHESVADIPKNANQLLNHRPVWQQLHDMLTLWMKTQLTRENIGEIEALFDKFVQAIITKEINRAETHLQSSKEFKEYLANEMRSRFSNRFTQIQDGISNFCSRTDAQFKSSFCFPLADLQQNLTSTLKRILCLVEEETVAVLITTGCKKLSAYYQAYNQKRLLDENIMSAEVIQHILKFYKEEIQSSQYQHPDNLEKIHESLSIRLKQVYNEVASLHGENSEGPDALTKELNKCFEDAERANGLKIEAAQKNVSSLIAKLKAKYEVEMDNLLQEHPLGVEEKIFEEHHKTIRKSVLQQFKTDIIPIVHNDEKKDIHKNTLKVYLEKSRDLFAEENQIALDENRPPSPTPTPPPKTGQNKHPLESIEQEPVAITSTQLRKQLPPLLFHLGLNRIGIGIMRDQNLCISYTSALIALTTDNQWIYGDEVRDIMSSNSGVAFKHSWQLGQCFSISSSQSGEGLNLWTDEILIGEHKVTITTEFILAMLLQTIKQKLEEELNGDILSTLISVPFWFPSFQRRQVLNAAKLAGFEQVHLLNENSSAAYFMHSSDLHGANHVTLVISESSHRVDASIYSYNEIGKRLLMIGHSGDYEYDVSCDRAGWMTYLPGYSILSRLFSKSKDSGEEDLAIRDLVDLCTRAIRYSEKLHFDMSKQRKILICCESDSWTNLLATVSKKVSSQEIIVQHNSVIHGMSSIYHNSAGICGKSYHFVRDGMPFYINIYSPKGERTHCVKKSDTLSYFQKREFSCVLSQSKGTFIICQENGSGKLPIGHIVLSNKNPSFNSVEVTISRSLEGIIWLKQLEGIKSGFWSTEKRLLRDEEYQWKSCNLNDNMLASYKDILHTFLVATSSSGKLTTCKEMGKEKVEFIENAVIAGRVTFPSEIVKTLVLKQVKDGLVFISQSESIEEVEDKIEWLNTLTEKFKIY